MLQLESRRYSTILTEVIDLGEGDVVAMGNIDGALFTIQNVGANTAFGLVPKLVIKSYAGGAPRVVKEIFDATITAGQNAIVSNNKMYFSVTGTNYNGIFVIGRKNPNYPFAVTQSRSFFNDTSVATTSTKFFYLILDYLFVACSDGTVSKTNDQVAYTATSSYESQKFSDGDPSNLKKLFGVALFTASLPSGGQVVLKYRKDEESSYTTIFTNTLLNSVAHDAVNIESTGANLPDFSEIQFKIESTGGAEVTGFKFVYDVMTDILG